MKFATKLAVLTAMLAISLTPTMAFAVPAADNPGLGHKPTTPATPKTPGPPGHAKAWGKRCQGLSKKHVKGEKGTPFSRCVNSHTAPAPAPDPVPAP